MKNTNIKTADLPISEDLKAQRSFTEQLVQSGFDFGLVLADAFVKGMRDIGYKSTATALDELIDNAIQGEAKNIHVTLNEGPKKRPSQIAVIDDGHGMDPLMIRAAVLWGGTHRHNNRQGFGRYGYGLPSACVSMGQRYTVYSRVVDGEWHEVTIDLQAIEEFYKSGKGGHVSAPEPKIAKLPSWVMKYLKEQVGGLQHGTVIVIDRIDRLSFWSMPGLREFFFRSFGVTYRNFLREVKLSVDGVAVEPIDPLFTTPGFRFHDIDDDRAQPLDPLYIEIKDKTSKEPVGVIKARFAYMPPTFLRLPDDKLKTKGGKNNARFPIRKENNGIIVLRSGRQIDVVNSKCPWTTFQNNDRYVGIEVDFPPTLDEEFSITTSKQQVVLSQRVWDILEENGVYEAIKEMRSCYDRDGKALEVQRDNADRKRASEAAMEAAEKFVTRTPSEDTPEQRKESRDNLEREARERAAKSGMPVETVKKELESQAQGRPYKVDYVDHPGAPFYSLRQVGGQKVLHINRAHRFYTDVYVAPDSTPNMRLRLEVLLFVLGDCELKTKVDDFKKFYESERAEWSKYLSIALSTLSDWYNLGDDFASATESVEASMAEAERVAPVQ